MKMERSAFFGTVKQFTHFIAQRSSEDRITQVAGSLTFTTVLSLVPLLTVMLALFTVFPVFIDFEQALHDFLVERLMPAQINSQIFEHLNQFAAQAKHLTVVGLIGLGVTAMMTMITIESAFNSIWRVRHPRPLMIRILVYWLILMLGPLLLGVSLSISSWLLGQSMRLLPVHPVSPFVVTGLASATVLLSAFAFTLLYFYLPHHRVKWRDALMGGLFAALSFELAKRGFGLYIRQFPTYTAVYGAFAAVPIFLLWVYLCWLITLFGAVLVAALPVFRTGKADAE
jgi:membrane protein